MVLALLYKLSLAFMTQQVYPVLLKLKGDLSKLNFHNSKHSFMDAINSMCPTNDGIEDEEHLLLPFLSLQCHSEVSSLEFLLYYDHMDIRVSKIMF